MDEFLDLILEHNTLLGSVADIFVIPAILVLIPFLAISSNRSCILYTSVCSVAKKMSSHDLVRSVKFLYLLGKGLGTL